MTTHKATITMGRSDAPVVYEGFLDIDYFYTDQVWWDFTFENPPFDNFVHLRRKYFTSPEAALADAQAHGIDLMEE